VVLPRDIHKRTGSDHSMITPFEYVNNCIPPCYPVGYQYCLIEEDKTVLEWSSEQVQEAKDLILQRYNNGMRFVFPGGVRYV
jgi:hypothetical protein